MKSVFSIFAIISLLATTQAWAGHEGHAHSHDHEGQVAGTSGAAGVTGATCKDTIHVKVNGLICDFCARALEKVFGKREEVSGIEVDLDNGLVTVATQPGMTMDEATLTKLITDSGYDVREIHKGC